MLAAGLLACGPAPTPYVSPTPDIPPFGVASPLATFTGDGTLIFVGHAAGGTLELQHYSEPVDGACPALSPDATATWNGTPLTLRAGWRPLPRNIGGFLCMGPMWELTTAPAPSALGYERVEVRDGPTTATMRFAKPTATGVWVAPSTGTARVQDTLSIGVLSDPPNTAGVTHCRAKSAGLQLHDPNWDSPVANCRVTAATPGDHVVDVSFDATWVGLCEGVKGCKANMAVGAGTLTLHIDP